MSIIALSCEEDDVKPNLRAHFDYNSLTNTTVYADVFVDDNGTKTVSLADGNNLHKMFQALNYYSTSSVSGNTHIDAAKLKALFTNSGNPFTDIFTSTISVVGADLNNSGVELKSVVASSLSGVEAEIVRAKIESYFDQIDVASNSVTSTAVQGQAGKLGTYLVDNKGIELAQVIQKSLIGALQLDYIGNVLLDEGLKAENYKTDGDKIYTALEHNWDVAYGVLTLNPIYLNGATDANRGTVEFGAGSYIWEYNKANYANIYPAFLKGRAAIVNNDKAELKTQAIFIRTEFEKTIASAALGYLDKWKTGTTDAARAHAIGEGLGFIYSLRFATIHEADAVFSDNLITELVGSTNGFWDISITKINTVADAIKIKFSL
jgi:FlaG/FlaF family flagellin (archaellin)